MIEKEIYSAKNDATIDAGIGLQQLYREALDNGFEGTIDDFIRTAPKKLLRQILKDGGEVNENSYKQLIDDYDKGIEVIEIDGKKEYLKNDLLHYSYPTLDEYFRKFNIYTRMGAEDLFARGKKSGLFGICIKPIAAFIKHYILKKGFLDGIEGFLISFLSAVAVMVKYAKLRELIKKKDKR